MYESVLFVEQKATKSEVDEVIYMKKAHQESSVW